MNPEEKITLYDRLRNWLGNLYWNWRERHCHHIWDYKWCPIKGSEMFDPEYRVHFAQWRVCRKCRSYEDLGEIVEGYGELLGRRA